MSGGNPLEPLLGAYRNLQKEVSKLQHSQTQATTQVCENEMVLKVRVQQSQCHSRPHAAAHTAVHTVRARPSPSSLFGAFQADWRQFHPSRSHTEPSTPTAHTPRHQRATVTRGLLRLGRREMRRLACRLACVCRRVHVCACVRVSCFGPPHTWFVTNFGFCEKGREEGFVCVLLAGAPNPPSPNHPNRRDHSNHTQSN